MMIRAVITIVCLICVPAFTHPVMMDAEVGGDEIKVYYNSESGKFTVWSLANSEHYHNAWTILMHGSVHSGVKFLDAIEKVAGFSNAAEKPDMVIDPSKKVP